MGVLSFWNMYMYMHHTHVHVHIPCACVQKVHESSKVHLPQPIPTLGKAFRCLVRDTYMYDTSPMGRATQVPSLKNQDWQIQKLFCPVELSLPTCTVHVHVVTCTSVQYLHTCARTPLISLVYKICTLKALYMYMYDTLGRYVHVYLYTQHLHVP